ncbi:MAG: Maf family protein [Planctomycetales bacterium]
MVEPVRKIILASRSPRRLDLLTKIVPVDQIVVIPPHSSEEAGFDGLHDWGRIEERLFEIVRDKQRHVLEKSKTEYQTFALNGHPVAVLSADTVIVVEDSTYGLLVLGQPPRAPAGEEVVRRWFREFYAGKTHTVVTGFVLADWEGKTVERTVKSKVQFHPDVDQWVDWYLKTGEPWGKAGGYALQGLGSVFINEVHGSISNVIGLPLRELIAALRELKIDVLSDH